MYKVRLSHLFLACAMVSGFGMLLYGVDSLVWAGCKQASLGMTNPTVMTGAALSGYGLLGVLCGLIIASVKRIR